GYTQGNRNLAMIKLTLYDETNFNIRWFSMDVRRDKPGGMNGDNTDFASVKIYSGDPYVRSAAGDVGINNTLIGSGVMQLGDAHVAVNDPQAGSPGYVLISTTPRVFYI